MAKNSYAQRRDYSIIGPVILGLLCVALAGLLLFTLFRPGPSASDAAATAANIKQMDASVARSEVARAEAERERQRRF